MDNAPYLQESPHIRRQCPISRDNGLYLWATPRIPRRRGRIAGYASYPETWNVSVAMGLGFSLAKKKRGDVPKHVPKAKPRKNYLVAIIVGGGAVGGTVGGTGTGVTLRALPRKGCTPNSATFSARMP